MGHIVCYNGSQNGSFCLNQPISFCNKSVCSFLKLLKSICGGAFFFNENDLFEHYALENHVKVRRILPVRASFEMAFICFKDAICMKV